MINLSSFLGTILISVASHAGWVSSGGELFRDAKNPWFLKNTAEITYCIDYSSQSISISKSDAEKKVVDAFDYWIAEFKKQGFSTGPKGINVGTQTFKQVLCDSNTDLRILFGYESLTSNEINFLVNPSQYIGVTVRTEYDEVNLKGKGFIYISSDFGPNAYDNSGNLVTRAWSQPKLLDYTLRHELGHVFGLSHEGTGLMSEVFLDQLLNNLNYSKFGSLEIPSYLMPDSEIEVCSGGIGTGGAFEVGFFQTAGAAAPTCLGVHMITFGNQYIWEISTKGKPGGTPTVVGKISTSAVTLADLNTKPAVVVQITNAQTVFSASETLGASFMYGPSFVDMGMNANFIMNGSTVKPVYVKITPNSLRILATYNGAIKPVFSYDSPINLLLQIH